jgi:hypothetical protein
MPMIRIIMLLAVVGAVVAKGQVGAKKEEASRVLTVCEILADPLRFDGKIIQVRGRTRSTDEGTWLVGDGCDGVFAREEYTWPSEIAFTPVPSSIAPRSLS